MTSSPIGALMTGAVLGVGHCTVVARVVASRGTGGTAPVPHNEWKTPNCSDGRSRSLKSVDIRGKI